MSDGVLRPVAAQPYVNLPAAISRRLEGRCIHVRKESWQTQGMKVERWYNAGQPQTLQLAQILLYSNAVIVLLSLVVSGGYLPPGTAGVSVSLITTLWILVLVGQVVGAVGIANSSKLAYRLGIVVALLPVALQLFVMVRYQVVSVNLFNLLFEAALIAALVHPQSRQYQRIWFR